MNKLKIFPSIGVARIGNADLFFLCPENENSKGIEFDGSGNEKEIENFKTGNLVKKQGSRFKVFEETSDGKYRPFTLPEGAVIKWTIRLANKKTATERTDPNIFYRGQWPPYVIPKSIPLKSNEIELTINSKDVVIDMFTSFEDRKSLEGTITINSVTKKVQLGSAFTDSSQNLIVLGGNGRAEGDNSITNFYTNESWFDDTSDGYIKAEIIIPGSPQHIITEGAWIIVAPTDFAPDLKGVVTLYDQLLEVAIKRFNYPIPHPTSFKIHIEPLIKNYMNLKWVEEDIKFEIPYTFNQLSNNSLANKQLRQSVVDKILAIPLDGHPFNGRKFEFTETQLQQLTNWANGLFNDDYTETISLDANTGDYLTSTVLKTTVGQGFFPGIEGGIIMCDPNLYITPFTLDHSRVDPGDITALMALPWQADFLECADDWWPTQRPYQVRPNLDAIDEVDEWQRPMGNESKDYAVSLIKNIHRLAFVKAKESLNGIVFVEDERDPTLQTENDLLQ